MRVLSIDIGGSHVKFLASGQKEARRFASGKRLTPERMVEKVRHLAKGWRYERISIGYPGLVGPDGPRAEPVNLGDGWVGFDFGSAFGCPVKILNDAAMQALGSYEGGRMLFLGLGTGLGSALISEQVIVPLELGTLPYRHRTFAEALSKEALKRSGPKAWQHAVEETVSLLSAAFLTDYVVLGGGNASKVRPLPQGARRGGNDRAFVGGFRLWETRVAPLDEAPTAADIWKMV